MDSREMRNEITRTRGSKGAEAAAFCFASRVHKFGAAQSKLAGFSTLGRLDARFLPAGARASRHPSRNIEHILKPYRIATFYFSDLSDNQIDRRYLTFSHTLNSFHQKAWFEAPRRESA